RAFDQAAVGKPAIGTTGLRAEIVEGRELSAGSDFENRAKPVRATGGRGAVEISITGLQDGRLRTCGIGLVEVDERRQGLGGQAGYDYQDEESAENSPGTLHGPASGRQTARSGWGVQSECRVANLNCDDQRGRTTNLGRASRWASQPTRL